MLRSALVIVMAAWLALGLGGCDRKKRPEAPASTLTVFAAASLAESFKELKANFEAANPSVKVNYNLGGSNQLRSQLEHGAPADVFASANTKEMDAAVKASVMDAKSVQVFVRNRLVVIYPRNNPARITTLADLARPNVKIDMADPAVPVGKYTVQMLDAMARDPAFGGQFKEGFLANVKSREENVKAVVSKVRLGEMDAGVVYVTDVGGEAARELGSLAIPDQYNQIADYPIGVTLKAGQPALAGKFVAFVLSPEGQRTMASYGFVPVAQGKP